MGTTELRMRKAAFCFGVFCFSLVLSGLISGCSRMAGLPELDKKQLAETRLQLGLAHLDAGNLALAQKNLYQAIQYAPEDYQILLALALYAQRTEDHRQAEGYYQQALLLSPKNATVHNNYGVFLCYLGKYVQARQQFNAALQVPDYNQKADSLENAAYCHLKANWYDEAKNSFIELLRGAPDKSERLLAEAEWLFDQKQYRQVRLLLDVYERVLPVSAQSLWLQARLAALTREFDRVKNFGWQLAQYFPQSEEYRQFLANEY